MAPGRERTGVLRVYDFPGTVLALGRHHRAPDEVAGITLVRRWTGGRAVPAGAGYVGVALVLPHRSALVADVPLALAPEQVMNRCVRGLLAALEAERVPALYPGRDLITARRRALALVSFDVDAQGVLLFEAIIGVGADLGALPTLLERADPGGVVPAEMLAATSVRAEGGEAPDSTAMAPAVAEGYETRMGVRCVARTAPLPAAVPDPGWLWRRRPRPDLDRRRTVRGQLGVVEVAAAADGDRVREVEVTGDLLAASPALAACEARLRGAPRDRTGIHAAVRAAFAPPAFLLGLDVDALADAIADAVA